jgi:hypothetical protein
MNNISKILLLVSILVSPCVSSASDYTCRGGIDAISQSHSGAIALISKDIYGDNSGRMVCNLNDTWNGVSVEVCKGWLSKLLSVNAMSKDIIIQYVDELSCTTQPKWSAVGRPSAFWESK